MASTADTPYPPAATPRADDNRGKPGTAALDTAPPVASGSTHHRADQARELGDEWAESLRCTVHEHPLTAVATAVAVGVLLTRLTQR